jgi:hypothetical protein
MSSSSGKSPFDLESLSKADLVRIVQRALSDPDGFPLWIRRELSSREGAAPFQREMRSQIQEVFGHFDDDTDATELIDSIRVSVATGAASPDQGASWTLEALETADEAIANHEDCEFEFSVGLDDLAELALDLLCRSSQTGKELARSLLSLLGLEHFGNPQVDLAVFARRLGAEGLDTMRSALEQKAYPDRTLLTQIYELQQDRSAWVALKLGSSNSSDQIAALDWIKSAQSPQAALERAAIHLTTQETSRSESLPVREWWYRERFQAGDPSGAIAEDAWATFMRHPCLPQAWNLLEAWASKSGTWEHFRIRALLLLERKEADSTEGNFRSTRIRIARNEGRTRDAWEIARLGLPRGQMLESIALAVREWPDEAQQEFDRILESALRGLEHTNSQGIYQVFADLMGKGKQLFGKAWMTIWSDRVATKYSKRPKLLQMVARA